MAPKLTRLCIYPKDIQLITGRSERHCREIMYIIRRSLNKQDHQFITIDEFCTWTGLDPAAVRQILPN